MDLKTVLCRTTDAAYRIYDGQATIVLPGRAEVKVLNPVGSLVWDRLNGSDSLERILEGILEEFEIPRRQAEHDLLEFANELRSHGMVT
jgi:hypothetical protein